MKKVSKSILYFIFILTLFVTKTSYCEISEEIFAELNEQDLEIFHKTFRSNCTSEVFFKNLKKHGSFPSFGKVNDWKNKCEESNNIDNSSNFLDFIITNFKLKRIDKTEGILTGYYQPIINVSRRRSELFKFPILKKNISYLGKTRKLINEDFNLSDVILWTDDKVDLFFLHIQGSGLGKLENKEFVNLSYSGNNDLKYSSIGNLLIKRNYLKPNNVDMFVIKNWLRSNPDLADQIMNSNERFIFFKSSLKPDDNNNPKGAIGVELIPNQSIAVDKKYYPLGLPFIIKGSEDNFIKTSISMDTGSAIKGPNRADLFFGRGKQAELLAGVLKKKIYLYAFIPYIK